MTGIIGDHRRPAGVAQQLQSRDPRKVGPYWLLGHLGSGGMGQVFLGRSPGGRLVAVKVVRAELAEQAEFRHRFAREVAAQGFSGTYVDGQKIAAPTRLSDGDRIAPKEIVLRIRARYRRFGLYETAILGMLAQSTGWATAAREVVDEAAPQPVVSFGARHVHPDITDVLDYAAIVGGCVGAVLAHLMFGLDLIHDGLEKRLAAALREPKRHLQLAVTGAAGLEGFLLALRFRHAFGFRPAQRLSFERAL